MTERYLRDVRLSRVGKVHTCTITQSAVRVPYNHASATILIYIIYLRHPARCFEISWERRCFKTTSVLRMHQRSSLLQRRMTILNGSTPDIIKYRYLIVSKVTVKELYQTIHTLCASETNVHLLDPIRLWLNSTFIGCRQQLSFTVSRTLSFPQIDRSKTAMENATDANNVQQAGDGAKSVPVPVTKKARKDEDLF